MAKRRVPVAGFVTAATDVRPVVRIDKWLWQARFYKTRSLATAQVAEGVCRINGVRTSKPAHPVGAGDTLTLFWGDRVRLIRVLGVTLRRGSAADVATLYHDLDDPLPAAARPLE